MSGASGETGSEAELLQRLCCAVVEDLRSLALLHDRELDKALVQALKDEHQEDFLGLALQGEEGRRALLLFAEGLSDIPPELDRETLDLLAVEYADIYLNNSLGASPCESVWLDDDGLIMQEPMFQIREWYRRYGIVVADWRKRSDDHLVNQLQFLAFLLESKPVEKALDESARFMDEHLLRWIDGFGERISNRTGVRFYAGLALLTGAYLNELRDLMAEHLGAPRPTREDIEARTRPNTGLAVEAPAPFVPGTSPTW